MDRKSLAIAVVTIAIGAGVVTPMYLVTSDFTSRIEEAASAFEDLANMQKITSKWTSDGTEHILETERKAGEAVADWRRRHKDDLAEMQDPDDGFPPDTN